MAAVDPTDIEFLRHVRTDIGAEIFGMDDVVTLVLIALLLRGHVLLEGNPGLGKTALVKALARALGLNESPLGEAAKKSWGRIQFTPDLMPSDITGTMLPDPERRDAFKFNHGPVFTNLLLADEINRATPKTQSAMLEAMAEDQVTVLGKTYPLTSQVTAWLETNRGTYELMAKTPFFVIATQNPIEQEGTNPLPEAQLDRFLFKIRMPFPTRAHLQEIIDKTAHAKGHLTETINASDFRETMLARLSRLAGALREVRPLSQVSDHILNMIMASVGRFDQLKDVQGVEQKELVAFCRAEMDVPLGPRAASSLTIASLGWAAVRQINPDEPEQIASHTVDALAHVVVPVLRHRMRFKSSLGVYGDSADDMAPDDRHDTLVRRFAEMTAPQQGSYADVYVAASKAAAKSATL